MSIYARNFIMDEETGLPVLVKHLNKVKINRSTLFGRVGGWNKSGKQTRVAKRWHNRRKRHQHKIEDQKLNY